MRRSLVTVLLLASLAFGGCLDGAFDRPEPDADAVALLERLALFPEWRMETDHGTIRMILYTGWTPVTAAHIMQLTDRGFYDGTTVHRVVDDFVIQGGDPTGTGEGGSGPLGLSDSVPLEISDDPVLDFGSGAVGLARWTDDTGDSQYFITEKPQIHLSRPNENGTGAVFGAYSLFAQVFEGMDVVRAIAQVSTDATDRPEEDVVVHNATILAPPKDADLIGLVLDVHPGVSTQGYQGTMEVPRIVTTDHPATIRFTTDSAGQAPCNVQLFGLTDPEGTTSYHGWDGVPGDPCTFESTFRFTAPGTYTIDLGVDEVVFRVLPWHDAYAPFTGTQTDMNPV